MSTTPKQCGHCGQCDCNEEQRMTPEEKIKALAELDGAHTGHWVEYASSHPAQNGKLWAEAGATWSDGSIHDELPPYLTSYDAIILLIQKQEDSVKDDVARFLFGRACVSWTLEATPAQLADALLVATGKMKV